MVASVEVARSASITIQTLPSGFGSAAGVNETSIRTCRLHNANVHSGTLDWLFEARIPSY
jgi:hypothetical protein